MADERKKNRIDTLIEALKEAKAAERSAMFPEIERVRKTDIGERYFVRDDPRARARDIPIDPVTGGIDVRELVKLLEESGEIQKVIDLAMGGAGPVKITRGIPAAAKTVPYTIHKGKVYLGDIMRRALGKVPMSQKKVGEAGGGVIQALQELTPQEEIWLSRKITEMYHRMQREKLRDIKPALRKR